MQGVPYRLRSGPLAGEGGAYSMAHGRPESLCCPTFSVRLYSDAQVIAMAILKIARMGHPVLVQPAQAIDAPADTEIGRLVADMLETMHDAGGVGLAAPQVHAGLRLFVYRVPPSRAGTELVPEGDQVLINPVLEPIGDAMELGWEGCLSIPGLRAAVPRFVSVRYTGLDRDGAPVSGEAHGFYARVLQHENDHLDGVLYPMRMTDFRLFGFEDEISRFTTPETRG
jgi:peptide deformylase